MSPTNRRSCEDCGAPCRGRRCGGCNHRAWGVSVPQNAVYEPEDAVEGALYTRDPAHDAAVQVARGAWPRDWLR